MRVAVVHDSLRIAGGAEKVCLKTIEVLKENGHEVCLGTVEPTDWSLLDRAIGRCTRPDREVHLANLSNTPLRVYMGAAAPLAYAALKRSCDACIQTNGDVVPIGDLVYVHFPPRSLRNDATFSQGSEMLRKLYSKPYAAVYQWLLRRIKDGHILANSTLTQRKIRQYLGRESKVVYPPVEVRKFESARKAKRRDSVVVCGRFSPEKNLEAAVRIAEMLPNVQFAIVGLVAGLESRHYFELLRRTIEARGINNLELTHNDLFSTLLEHFSRSRIILSTKVDEPFGLSVVEGMSAGLVPVVHRTGGPWVDSLGAQDGLYGYSYEREEEAARTIRRLLSNRELCDAIVKRNSQRVELFSDSNFKKHMYSEFLSLTVSRKE